MLRVSVLKFVAMGFALAVVVSAGLFAWTNDLSASTSEEKTPLEAPTGDAHVQLRSFMAPVLASGHRRFGAEPVTLVLKVPAQNVPTICTMTPRILDAVMRELYRKPIPADRKKNLHVKDAEDRLVAPVSKALGGAEVQRIFILQGAHARMVAKQAAQRLPTIEIVGCEQL